MNLFTSKRGASDKISGGARYLEHYWFALHQIDPSSGKLLSLPFLQISEIHGLRQVWRFPDHRRRTWLCRMKAKIHTCFQWYKHCRRGRGRGGALAYLWFIGECCVGGLPDWSKCRLEMAAWPLCRAVCSELWPEWPEKCVQVCTGLAADNSASPHGGGRGLTRCKTHPHDRRRDSDAAPPKFCLK